MKLFHLPPVIEGLIFDIDNTLYRDERYVNGQIVQLIARLARERGESFEVTNSMVETYRTEQAAQNGGRKPSLGNTFVHFGVPIEQSVRWREEELNPEEYLSVDLELDALLADLAGRYRIACVTNNPSTVGRRTLAALGVEHHFRVVIGLESTMVSKPHVLPFQLAAAELSCRPDRMVSIGDRYEIDIEPALSTGMGGILVESREDLFSLPLD